MIADFRRNTLANIGHLVRKMRKMQNLGEERQREALLASMLGDVDLLRSDTLLILNQNFYLQCKLAEKDERLQELEKKQVEMQAKHTLSITMLKQRYQKQMQNMRFDLFLGQIQHQRKRADRETNHGNPEEVKLDYEVKCKAFRSQQQKESTQNNSTVKKQRDFVELKSNKAEEDAAYLASIFTNERIVPDRDIQAQFDLQLRLDSRNGLMSEEMTNFSNKVGLQMVKSNDIDDCQQTKNKKRRSRGSVSSVKKEQKVGHGKKKSEELADLVAQQFKISQMKEKYFATDLF